MAEFKDDEGDFFNADSGADTATDDAGNGGFSLDLSEGDLTSGVFKNIPVGTWLHVKFYDVTPSIVKSGNNYGKPKYQIAFMTEEDSSEWGDKRKFTVFANLFGKAFFIAYPILRAVGLAPTKDDLKVGAFFSSEDSDEFPADMSHIFTAAKDIPKGAYIMPAPSKLTGKDLWAKVGEYSGNNSGFKRYASAAAALADKDDSGNVLNTRAFPQLTEFMSGDERAKQMNGASEFKGDE